jgi:hypothetical protein
VSASDLDISIWAIQWLAGCGPSRLEKQRSAPRGSGEGVRGSGRRACDRVRGEWSAGGAVVRMGPVRRGALWRSRLCRIRSRHRAYLRAGHMGRPSGGTLPQLRRSRWGFRFRDGSGRRAVTKQRKNRTATVSPRVSELLARPGLPRALGHHTNLVVHSNSFEMAVLAAGPAASQRRTRKRAATTGLHRRHLAAFVPAGRHRRRIAWES